MPVGNTHRADWSHRRDDAGFNRKLSRRVYDELNGLTFQVEASNYSVGVYYGDDWIVRAYTGWSQVLIKTYRRGTAVNETRIRYDVDAVLKEIRRQLSRVDELRIKELEKLADEIAAEDQS